ncbi:MAG: hypothetical protein RIQ52_1364 [Pseudomonadota bacterium]|jgi:NADH-quinone oxidoreductase subunit M
MHNGGLSLNTAVPVALIMMPMAGALCSARTGTSSIGRHVGTGILLLQLLLIVSMILGFDSSSGNTQYLSRWLILPGMTITFAIDGTSLLFMLVSHLLALAALVYAPSEKMFPRGEAGLVLLFLVQAQLTAGFMIQDLVQFMAIDTLGLLAILYWIGGDPATRIPIRRQLLLGQGLMLLAALILFTWVHAATGSWESSPEVLAAHPMDAKSQNILFFLFFYGLCFRVGQFPFHHWLPSWLASQRGVLLPLLLIGNKSGIYLLLRFIKPALADAVTYNAPFIRILGISGALYGAVLALIQIHAMKQLAYAFVSQSGIIMLGLFALNISASTGCTILAVQYGLAAGGLLVATHMSAKRSRTMLIPRMGGLFSSSPQAGLLFLVSTLGAVAMPGTGGFDGAHLLVEGLVTGGYWLMAIGVGVTHVMTTAFLLWSFQRQYLAKRIESRLEMLVIKVPVTETLLVLAFSAWLLLSGMTSQYWMQMLQPATPHHSQPERMPP